MSSMRSACIRAIPEVLYSTGLRRMETVNLRVYDIDRGRGLVFVNQGEWQKDRWVRSANGRWPGSRNAWMKCGPRS